MSGPKGYEWSLQQQLARERREREDVRRACNEERAVLAGLVHEVEVWTAGGVEVPAMPVGDDIQLLRSHLSQLRERVVACRKVVQEARRDAWVNEVQTRFITGDVSVSVPVPTGTLSGLIPDEGVADISGGGGASVAG